MADATSKPEPTPDRVQVVDDFICDLLTALSLKRNKDAQKQRAWIAGYARAIVAYCDSHPPVRVSASGSVKLNG